METALAFGGLEEFARRSIEAFILLDQSIAKMEASLRGSGQYTKQYSAELQEMAKGLSEVTLYHKAELINLQGVLLAFGAGKEDLKTYMNAILDLSTLMGKDLPGSMMVFTAALEGNFGPAQRALKIHFDNSTNGAEKFVTMLEKITALAGGQATAAVNTLSGEFEIQRKAIDELQEEIGHGLLQSFSGWHSLLKEMTLDPKDLQTQLDDLKAWETQIRDLIHAMVDMGAITEAQGNLMRTQMSGGNRKIESNFGHAGLADPDTNTTGLSSDLAQQRAVFQLTQDRLTSNGIFGSRAQPQASNAGRNYEEEKTALEELVKLEEKYRTAGLEGLDKQKAEIEVAYDAEYKAIIKNSNLANEGADKEMQRLQQWSSAKTAALDDIARKESERLDKLSLEDMKGIQERSKAEQAMMAEITSTQLRGLELRKNGMESEMAVENANHLKRIQQLQQVRTENEDDYNKLMGLESKLHEARLHNINEEHSAAGKFQADLNAVGGVIREQLTTNLAHGLVDSFSKGGDAMKQWFADFMKAIAEAIIKMELLYILRTAFGGSGTGAFLGLSGGGQVSAAALGGMFSPSMAADGFSGMTNGPTFMPNFNVLAGEAGAELLTVFAKPRLAQFGDITATVGQVGSRQMALVNAGALQRAAGPGGQLEIKVTISPELEARITRNSIEGARVRVAQDLSEDSHISRAAKNLTA